MNNSINWGLETMLNKQQIRERINWILDHKEVTNKTWFVEQLESLLASMDSPEVFVEKMRVLWVPRRRPDNE